jgi:hypothetical protein
MIPKIDASLTQDELRHIFEASHPTVPGVWTEEDWERHRKYAYSKYWERRLAEPTQLSDAEVSDWTRFLSLAFLSNVAWGIVGEAARRDLLRPDQSRLLGSLGSISEFARRQLGARECLRQSSCVDQTLVDGLIDLKAFWALHELLRKPLTLGELHVLRQAISDRRVPRGQRHELGAALSRRAK